MDRMDELRTIIESFPRSSITKKTVKGRTYHYLRWTENGKRREKYIPESEVGTVSALVAERKRPGNEPEQRPVTPEFRLRVITGNDLTELSRTAGPYRKRRCFGMIMNYLRGKPVPKVMVLYGLRRTGKTTLIRQSILEMEPSELEKTAFIQVRTEDSFTDLDHDLDILRRCGFAYVFVDEATLLDNFVEASAVLADIYATFGMRLVLSGTDSLGFVFAEDDSLFDRCIFVHTTVIPYHEFESVLGVSGIDAYIELGGTMCPNSEGYNGNLFRKAGEYINSSIALNIQHALGQYRYGGHFGNLAELYGRNELTNVINRIVEDINHRFALDVITREFRSGDLSQTIGNLIRDRDERYRGIASEIDIGEVNERLKERLDIIDAESCSVKAEQSQVDAIEEYLGILEVVSYIDVITDLKTLGRTSRTLITQPGLRYAQAMPLSRAF